MQIGNQILDKSHNDSPGGMKFELAAETQLMLVRFNAFAGTDKSALPAGVGA